jgi:hypothetical protein
VGREEGGDWLRGHESNGVGALRNALWACIALWGPEELVSVAWLMWRREETKKEETKRERDEESRVDGDYKI